ncbi:MAG: Calx-beta domain-containing protein, partial [Pseudomonadales bacterium]
VSFETSDGTATMGDDYFAKTGMAMIAPGETSTTVSVTIINDVITERDELLTFRIKEPSNAILGTTLGAISDTSEATGTIIDDDVTEIRMTAVAASITEGEDALFIVSVSPALRQALPIAIDMTDTGNFIAGESPQWVTLAYGDTAATLTIATEDDEVGEPKGTITASLPADMTPLTVVTRSARVEVLDNDRDPNTGRNVNAAAMPYIAMAVADETALAIRQRVRSAFNNEHQSGLLVQGSNMTQLVTKLVRQQSPELSRDEHEFTQFDAWRSEQKHREALWKRQAPQFNLGDFAFAMQSGGQWSGVEGSPSKPLTFWGQGFHHKISGVEYPMHLSGEVVGGITGFDIRWPNFIMGLGLSMADGELDFRKDDITGIHKTHMEGVRPYLGWQTSRGSRFYGVLGLDRGDIEVIEDDAPDLPYRRDVELQMVALGGQGPGHSWSSVPNATTKISFVIEGIFARMMELDSALDAELGTEPVVTDAGRVRFGFEMDHNRTLANGGNFGGKMELTARHDSGDALTGAGAELGGSINVSLPGKRLEFEIGGRTLFAHETMGVEEWGLSASLLWTARDDGRGLSLAFKPQWGDVADGSQALWDGGLASHQSLGQGAGFDGVGRGGLAGLGYSLEVKYGIPVLNATEMLILFARNETGQDRDNLGLGASLKVGNYLHVESEAIMSRHESNKIEHRPQIRYKRKH